MKRRAARIGTLLCLLGSVALAYASDVGIEYKLSGNTYSYTVANHSLSQSVELFDIFFPDIQSPDAFNYSGIAASATPANWIGSGTEPSAVDLGGFVEFSSLISGIGVGHSQNGFEATFNHTGSANPGSQFFLVFDENLNVIASGYTVHGQSVPDACGWLCYLLAALPIAGLRFRELFRHRSPVA
jgi:hypothetical protein